MTQPIIAISCQVPHNESLRPWEEGSYVNNYINHNISADIPPPIVPRSRQVRQPQGILASSLINHE